ncbi:MAG: hypothetical protein GYB58_14755 [Gammaproteobacteria bacterium]|nr:hypothetical protein [Gammaproteobacteria bacterium]
MTKSNQMKGEENARILRECIKNNKSFPMHKGRLNKTKLLADLGIPSARQRPECAEILNELDAKIAEKRAKEELPDNEEADNTQKVKRLRQYINALQQKLALKEAQLDAYRRNEASELLLVKTGKILPSAFNPQLSSLDLLKDDEQ